GDLEQRLVDLDGVADLLEPLGDGALGDGLAQLRHLDVGRLAAAGTAGLLRLLLGLGVVVLRLVDGVVLVLGLGLLDGLLRRDVLVLVIGVGIVGAGGVGVADARDDRTDVDGVVDLGEDLDQGAGDRRRNLGVDLVGGDLEQRLVNLDGVADLLEPLGDGALGDGLAQLRHLDVGGLAAAGTAGLLRLLVLLLGLLGLLG